MICSFPVKKCPANYISSFFNGKLMTYQSAFFYGDIISYICDVGFTVSGSLVNVGMVTCENDGTWSSTPACESMIIVFIVLHLVFYNVFFDLLDHRHNIYYVNYLKHNIYYFIYPILNSKLQRFISTTRSSKGLWYSPVVTGWLFWMVQCSKHPI